MLEFYFKETTETASHSSFLGICNYILLEIDHLFTIMSSDGRI